MHLLRRSGALAATRLTRRGRGAYARCMRWRSRVLLTSLAAAAVLAAPVAATLHAFEAHRYCAQHEAVEDGAPLRSGESGTDAGVAFTKPDARAQADAAHGEVCMAWVASRTAGLVASPPSVPASPAAAPSAPAAPDGAGYPPLRALAVAPKSSPPLA